MCLSDEESGAGQQGGRSISDGGRNPIDRILLALSEPRCRYLLYYLDDRGDAYIEEVARFIAACERGCDPSESSEDHVEQVKRDLYHVHLPKLAESNIIDYDRRSRAMCFQNPPPNLSSFLGLASTVELSEAEVEKF